MNDETESGNSTPTDPPVLLTQPHGLTTSSGQLTVTITLVCTILAALGFHFSPDQFLTWFDAAEHWATIATPIVVMLIQIFNFTNSRGKIASNTVNANKDIQVAALVGKPVLGQVAELGTPILGKLITHEPIHTKDILEGENWKDPERYMDIVSKVVPIFGALFHKKAVTSTKLSSDEQAQLDALLSKANG